MPKIILDLTKQPLCIELGNTRPEETDDARDNWSTESSGQRGYTKHHGVPWATLRVIFNQGLSNLQVKQNDGLLKSIIGCSYRGSHGGANQRPLTDAIAFLKKGLQTVANPAPPYRIGEVDTRILPQAHHDAINDLASYFCWMPGNFCLGPTPQSRTDDPGNEGFDAPPKHQGGKRVLLLETLYNQLKKDPIDWSEVHKTLDELKKEGVANQGNCVKYKDTDWTMTQIPNSNAVSFRKK